MKLAGTRHDVELIEARSPLRIAGPNCSRSSVRSRPSPAAEERPAQPGDELLPDRTPRAARCGMARRDEAHAIRTRGPERAGQARA
jgi:hypothetical protein